MNVHLGFTKNDILPFFYSKHICCLKSLLHKHFTFPFCAQFIFKLSTYFFLILKVLLKCKHTRILCKLPNALLRWIDEIHWWCMSIYVNFSSFNWTIQCSKLEYTKLCYHSSRRICFMSLSIIEIPYYLVQSCHGRLRSCMMVLNQAPWLHLDF